MNPEFWLQRWQDDQIGFHQDQINPHLMEHRSALGCAAGARVFVPLCGKSRDLVWLAEQGCTVLGVEISTLAVQALFQEQQLAARRQPDGAFERWQHGSLTVLAGDFFDLESEHLRGVRAVYDRASLIALPPAMRQDYARHLMEILPPEAPMLLVTLEYPQEEMNGPPFSVSEAEVQRLYGSRYNVRCLARHDVWAQTPRFRDQGLSALEEKVYLLART